MLKLVTLQVFCLLDFSLPPAVHKRFLLVAGFAARGRQSLQPTSEEASHRRRQEVLNSY
jgi:hypothetical protein